MTTNSVSRIGIRNIATSVMMVAIAVAAGSTMLTRTAAADDGGLPNQISASELTPAEPDRNVIDPGSLFRVDRYVNDSDGVTYRQTGYRWTSLGVPQNKLTLTRIETYTEAPDPVVVSATPAIQYYASYPSFYAYSHGYHGYHGHHDFHDHHDSHSHHESHHDGHHHH
jgi:hypothetical protein